MYVFALVQLGDMVEMEILISFDVAHENIDQRYIRLSFQNQVIMETSKNVSILYLKQEINGPVDWRDVALHCRLGIFVSFVHNELFRLSNLQKLRIFTNCDYCCGFYLLFLW